MNDDGAEIDLSSACESSMDDTSNDRHHRHKHRKSQPQTLTKSHSLTTTDNTTNLLPHPHSFMEEDEGENEHAAAGHQDSELASSEMLNTFTDSFQQVQSILDRNRVLIQQVNENHRSKIHDNLVKNVSLIQEINGNINKVVSLYSDLSVNFSGMCHQRNAAIQSTSEARKSDT